MCPCGCGSQDDEKKVSKEPAQVMMIPCKIKRYGMGGMMRVYGVGTMR